MNISEWLQVCADISRLWPNKPMPPDAAQAWYPLLADLPGPTVAQAVRRCALDPGNVWPPSLGQIRAACEPPEQPWEAAFARLRRLVAKHGAYAPPPGLDDVADVALSQVIDAYGWRSVCALNPDDPTVRAQFRAAYNAASRQLAETRRARIAARATGHRAELTTGTQP